MKALHESISLAARRLAPYLPYPHFMCVAPLDAVLRILWRAEGNIPPAYWPRLVLLLLLSGVNTVASLPERVILAAWLRLRPPQMGRDNAPVFVLGYFRSGTTFLQNLLAADPDLRSPSWPQVLAPQAFVPGWFLLRYLFVPLLPLTRLGAVVPVGAKLPGEDDFALNNLGGMSVLAGRAILPRRQAFFNRFHDLDALSKGELSRWRSHQFGFVQKLTLVAGGRRLLLKSPSHTARVRYLQELFPGAKFVHISRSPEVVFRSNLLLARELQRAFALQPPLPEDEQEEIITCEYLATEMHYLADRAQIPAADLAEVRLQDLTADPVGEMKRIYRELGLPFSRGCEERILQVAATFGKQVRSRHPDLTERQKARVARLEPLAAAFGHASLQAPETLDVDSQQRIG
ncbi:sulfotransferase [Mesorhizobium sp. M7D.F.Ca.US.005.01.1.1]|uniref:sulfotransferase family protein n=1 Tax=Mesorhizobium sp. M7D.F.Ca.US.005.01.1.1 TaxID=2493678 RepID=UPI000F7515C1|nr:sulfotransferase [Mesorhizobium sp. M7D.F.Ca.US.005.01.1.1]AZO43727.1 sulfotransferase [Mesorhizobium sp. M7D.F.Ca.US.005.01.1.1]